MFENVSSRFQYEDCHDEAMVEVTIIEINFGFLKKVCEMGFYEIYVPIRGFEEYGVSNLGNVKSYKYGKEKILKPIVNGFGYYQVILWKNNIRYASTIHRLVALHHLDEPISDDLIVDHIDRNKINNHVSNLRYITLSQQNSNNN